LLPWVSFWPQLVGGWPDRDLGGNKVNFGSR
jgi:hypothetical protein